MFRKTLSRSTNTRRSLPCAEALRFGSLLSAVASRWCWCWPRAQAQASLREQGSCRCRQVREHCDSDSAYHDAEAKLGPAPDCALLEDGRRGGEVLPPRSSWAAARRRCAPRHKFPLEISGSRWLVQSCPPALAREEAGHGIALGTRQGIPTTLAPSFLPAWVEDYCECSHGYCLPQGLPTSTLWRAAGEGNLNVPVRYSVAAAAARAIHGVIRGLIMRVQDSS